MEKRHSDRLVYPLAAAPVILNMRAQIVGITAKAVRFFFADFDPQMGALKKGSKVKVNLKFHDEQASEISGVILRKDKYLEDKDHFVCLFDKELPQERMDTERAYLLKEFPDISNEADWDSPPIIFFE